MKMLKPLIIALLFGLTTAAAHAQCTEVKPPPTATCNETKPANTMKTSLALVISTNDAETAWNALRLANYALTQKEVVSVFLLGKGVETEKLNDPKFDVKKQMQDFVTAGGQIMACGTCLKIRNEPGTALCPVSTMADLYALIKQADKVLTF